MMERIWQFVQRLDPLMLLVTLALVAFGVVAIMGATINQDGGIWQLQLAWALIGLCLMAAALMIDYRFLVRYAPVLYGLTLLLLILVLTPLGYETKGAQSWLRIPGLNRGIQPAEFAKLGAIFMLAYWLGWRKGEWSNPFDLYVPLLIGAVPALLILKQPDLGSAVIFGPMTIIMMFVAGMPFSYLLCMIAPAFCVLGIFNDPIYLLIWLGLMSFVVLVIIWEKVSWTACLPFLLLAVVAYAGIDVYGQQMWNSLDEYKKDRILTYWDPEHDPKGASYNFIQAKIALGSGGFWGKGLGQGTQSKFGFVPELEHDFVFATFGEQLGFLGAAILLGLFMLLMIRGLDTATQSRSMQGALLASGVIAMFLTHILINIGMIVGLLPVTGLPLTFISYGGTFMVTSLIGVGLIMNIRMQSTQAPVSESTKPSKPAMVIPTSQRENFSEF